MANPYYYTSSSSSSSSSSRRRSPSNKSTTTCADLLLLLITSMIMLLSSSAQQNENGAIIMNLDDFAALRAIRDSLTDLPHSSSSATGFFSTWNFSSPNPCSTFSGVVCSPLGRVDILSLGTGLSGSLSPSLSNLTQLTQLILYPGLVTGPIPLQLGRSLRVISLSHNRLTGSIPASLSALPNLHTLDLSFNSLTGAIPPALFLQLPELRILVLSSNSLSGQLPREVSTQLLHVDLKDNQLTGELPWHMPSSLRYLSVSNNLMWGPLLLLLIGNGSSSSYSSMPVLSELEYLDLSMNQFSGPIPPSLFSLLTEYSLSTLFLQRNNLSGPLPQMQVGPHAAAAVTTTSNNNYYYIGGERSVVMVDLSHNLLSGELTTALAGVQSLYLNNNLFTGRVPREYVEGLTKGTIKTLYLQHNYFTEFPLGPAEEIPDTASLCMSYNCFALLPVPQGTAACPTSSGFQISRPRTQCKAFNNPAQALQSPPPII